MNFEMVKKLAATMVYCCLLFTVNCKPEVPKKERQVIFNKVEYEINKEIMTMNVVLKNNTGNIPTVDLDAELFVEVPDNVYITNIISRRASKMEYHALIKTGKIDLCEFFKNPDREPFLKILLGNLERFGHMMFSCPVKKGKYYLRDFYLDANTLPSFTPPGDYRVDFAVTKKEKNAYVQFYRMLWYASVVN